MKITFNRLNTINKCGEDLQWFCECYPEGVDLSSEELIFLLEKGINVWQLCRLLPPFKSQLFAGVSAMALYNHYGEEQKETALHILDFYLSTLEKRSHRLELYREIMQRDHDLSIEDAKFAEAEFDQGRRENKLTDSAPMDFIFRWARQAAIKYALAAATTDGDPIYDLSALAAQWSVAAARYLSFGGALVMHQADVLCRLIEAENKCGKKIGQ
jgi:hypothetical protein